MGVRTSNTSEPMDRCALDSTWYPSDGAEGDPRPLDPVRGWNHDVNLWCPRSSLGRRSCKRSGCCAELPMLEEMEG